MTTPDAEEQQVRELLGQVERDGAQISGRRDEILHDVLAHYERSRQQTDTDVILLRPTEQAAAPRRTALLWVASIAILSLVAGLVLLAGDRDGLTPADTTPVTPTPADVLVFADGYVTIDVPDGLSVIEQRDGFALLTPDATGNGIDDAIVIAEHGSQDFSAEMSRLSIQGVTTGGLTRTNVDGRRVDRWSIAITQQGITDIDCPPDHDCLELVPGVPATALKPGLRVDAVELVGSNEQTVLVMTNADGPLRSAFADVLAGTTVDQP